MNEKREYEDRVTHEDEVTLAALAAELRVSDSDAETTAVLVRVDACVAKILRRSI